MSSQVNTTTSGQATVTAIVSLGSNLPSKLGGCEATLRAAIERLASLSQAPLLVSSLYFSEPIDCAPGTPSFINAVAALKVDKAISPQGLLARLLELEAEFGRQRGELQNQPRSLDLDLITYGEQLINEEFLTLPHPRAGQRRFVLQPIAEIAPAFVLPGQTRTVEELLALLDPDELPLYLVGSS